MLVQRTKNSPVMGEVIQFYEIQPFEVDGITYDPPSRPSPGRIRPMFELKEDDDFDPLGRAYMDFRDI